MRAKEDGAKDEDAGLDMLNRHQSCESCVVGLSAIIMSLIMSLKCEHGVGFAAALAVLKSKHPKADNYTHMLGSEYGEQDRKASVLYEYETFKTTEGELLIDTCIRYLQVNNDFKKCGYSKDNCELNFKFLNNLQPEWKQYVIMTRQNKNLLDINIDALYNILKQNQGGVNDAMKSKKKAVVITSDPLALVAEQTKVSKRKEQVVVSSESEGSDDE
nr:integrase, catalytic region, zinc finger, CCHC-type, peptidase aspartic, catalytic [Tanacetum cinerariifolium]